MLSPTALSNQLGSIQLLGQQPTFLSHPSDSVPGASLCVRISALRHARGEHPDAKF